MDKREAMLSFLVIGCGSIGSRHADNLLILGQTVYIYDREPERMKEFIRTHPTAQVFDFKSHHLKIDAWVIATPPNYHIPFSFEALSHDIKGIFIEKPISHNLDKVDETINQAKEKGLVIQVGYQFRFHPGLQLAKKLLDEGKIGKLLSIRAEFGQYLPNWHPNEDYRNLYTCHEQMGGGILLESSHEIDYVRWLAGEVTKVSCFAGKVSNLDIDVEDTADILLYINTGIIGNIHVDMIQQFYTRYCKLIGEEGNILWEYPNYQVQVSRKTANGGHVIINEPIAKSDYPDINFNADMYLEEMRHFVACVEGKEKPVVDAETGKRVLEIALAAKESARENKVVEV